MKISDEVIRAFYDFAEKMGDKKFIEFMVEKIERSNKDLLFFVCAIIKALDKGDDEIGKRLLRVVCAVIWVFDTQAEIMRKNLQGTTDN